MSSQAEVLVLTPQESRMEDLEGQLGELTESVKDLPNRIRKQAPAPQPKPAREEQLRSWAD